MRRLSLVLLGLLAIVSDAFAGGEFEVPTLRGSDSFAPAAPVRPRWGGAYVGGQLGYGNAGVDFSGTTQPLIAHMLRELALENEVGPSRWQVLGTVHNGGATYGGFV